MGPLSFSELEEIIDGYLQVQYEIERLEIFGDALGQTERKEIERFIELRQKKFTETITYLQTTYDNSIVRAILSIADDSGFDALCDSINRELFSDSLLAASIDTYIGFCAAIQRYSKERKNALADKISEHFDGLAEKASLQNIVGTFQWVLQGGPSGAMYFANMRILMLVRRDIINRLALKQLLAEKNKQFSLFKDTLRMNGITEL